MNKTEQVTRFRALHARPGAFVIPNPWDAGSARILAALGFEALSRGAASVTLVESDRAAAETLRRNVAAVGLPGAAIVRRDAAAYLDGPPATEYDLVFADPPYALAEEDLARLLGRLAQGWLGADAVVVVERSARGAPVAWPEGVVPVMNRRYGEGVLWYGRPR